MEQDIEWKGKYKSELLMVCHTGAKAMYEVGAISDKEMKEYDRDCLAAPAEKIKNNSADIAKKAVPVYAASGSR
jgi:DNA-binding transcriptional regulator YiaG